MKKTIIFIVIFGLVGLIAGYLLFGEIAGEYVSLKAIFGTSGNAIESLGRKIIGLTEIKHKIFISGGIGAIVGLIITFVKRK